MHTFRPIGCLGAAALVLATAAVPAQGQIWKRIKDRAGERVRETVDGAVDRTVGGVAGAVERRAGGAAAGENRSGTPAAPAAAPEAAPAAAGSTANAGAALTGGRDTIPPAAGPVLPGRAGAAQGLRDEDVAWLLPLLDAEAADAGRRGVMLATAGADQSRGGGVIERIHERGRAQVGRMRGGELDPLTVLKERVDPRYVVAPPGARYDAACSIALTEGRILLDGDAVEVAFTMGADAPAGVLGQAVQGGAAPGTQSRVEAAFRTDADLASQPAVERALSWYRSNGFTTVGLPGTTDHSFAPRADQEAVAVTVWKANILHAPYLPHITDPACSRLPSGPVIVISQPSRGIGRQLDDAMQASVAGQAERLPAALRQARLTPEEWTAVLQAVAMARVDAENEADNPGFLAVMYGERPDELARREAAAAWFRRHQAQLAPRLDAATTMQGY